MPVFIAMIAFSISKVNYFTFEMFHRISRGSYYVEATGMGPFLALSIPCLLSLVFITIFNFKKNSSKKVKHQLGIIFVISAILAIAGRLLMWPIVIYQLNKHDYTYCFFYSPSNIHSPSVYVKHPKYCFKGSRSVTSELFAWFDKQEKAGVELTPFEVKQKIDALKEEKGTDWQSSYRLPTFGIIYQVRRPSTQSCKHSPAS